jgi:sortase A
MKKTIQRLLPFLMVAAGVVLLFQGTRLWIESHLGQSAAARQFGAPEAALGTPRESNDRMPEPPPRLGDTVAKLVIPRLNVELYVVEGDGATELRRGPGHLAGSAMPGGDGNCIIAGHRDTHFRILKDLRRGDEIVLKTRLGQYLYRVKRLSVVAPKNTASLQPTTTPELHLITCYPFYYVGSAPKRFVVEADLAGAITAASAGGSRPAIGSPRS